MMSQQARYRLEGKVSFSWEKKPGVAKVTSLIPKEQELPPPPCTMEASIAKNPIHDFQIEIPLPPCAFQPPYYRTSSKRGLWVQHDDPFVAAYKECTKSKKHAKMNKKLTRNGIGSRVKKSMCFLSCYQSCTVRDNNLVRISYLDKH
ncbi:hypothetical protein RJT34_08466 [Clitoria ternatea]|uniref:Uncharacterized protein n=1 Tax=Clitoria ternatea TaxID=43366 RepID=A0AAN9K4H2_CLITE